MNPADERPEPLKLVTEPSARIDARGCVLWSFATLK